MINFIKFVYVFFFHILVKSKNPRVFNPGVLLSYFGCLLNHPIPLWTPNCLYDH
jgi:hypothetical protein